VAQALTYFCIYVVRQGVTSWFVFYLMKVSTPLQAPSIFSLVEAGLHRRKAMASQQTC